MQRIDVEKLLIIASAIDNRIVSEPMVEAWFQAIGHHDADAAVQALHDFRRVATSEYLVPGHITHHIKLRRAREREIYGMRPQPGHRWAVDAIELDPIYNLPPTHRAARPPEIES